MGAKPLVVFVHGLWMNGLELAWLRRRVAKAGFTARQFLYPTVRCGLVHNSEALFRFARGLDAREIHFVGYSLGGVVTLNMLARFGEMLPAGRVVLIGSPVRGSGAARRMAERGWGRFMLGGSAPGCLIDDHEHCWHGERELGVIAGTRSLGLGSVFGRLPSPNDGTVAVDETRLESETDRMELPLTHATLMFSQRVAEAVVGFLATGTFETRVKS
ncbi:MAG TPA: alpha/beta hydrolase [Gammaproteobacteria bacterium]